MLNPQNISLLERAKYFPDTLDRDALIDALETLAEFVALGSTPEDLEKEVNELRDTLSETQTDLEQAEDKYQSLMDECGRLEDRIAELERGTE